MTRTPPHLLRIAGIRDEGWVEFEVVCPVAPDGRCPYDADPTTTADGFCVVREELSMIGSEIIRGEASGPGPWPVELTYEGWGEEAEGYIDLIPDPVLAVDDGLVVISV